MSDWKPQKVVRSLMHHGIKGQKWGKRNGPPYPLKPEVKKKAYANKETIGGRSGNIPSLYGPINLQLSRRYAFLIDREDFKRINRNKMRKSIKKASATSQETTGNIQIQPAKVATTALAAYGLFNAAQVIRALYPAVSATKFVLEAKNKATKEAKSVKDLSNSDKLSENRKTEKIDPETGLYLKNGETSADDDMSKINPNFDKNGVFQLNSAMCVAAMEMRQRGYDVASGKITADELYKGGIAPSKYQKWFGASESDKGKVTRIEIPDKVDFHLSAYNKPYMAKTKTALKKGGDGSRGELALWYRDGLSYNLYYKIEGGKTVIYDPVSNSKITESGFDTLLKDTTIAQVRRLDTLTPNVKQMKKDGAIV